MSAAQHVVQFYEDEAFLLDSVARFCGNAIAAGGVGVVIATEPHRQGIVERLRAADLLAPRDDPDRFVAVDASETIARFMVSGAIDSARFAQEIVPIVSDASKNGRRAHVFGEMVALLMAEGNHSAAVQLEALWNEVQQAHAFTLFCAYPMAHFGGDAQSQPFHDVCAAHSHVIPAESFTTLPAEPDRLRQVARLQQQAQRLEAEIAERRQAEERLRVALEAEHASRLEAETALRSRDDFLSIAAHELRNPLAGISLLAQVALRRIDRDARVERERITHALGAISDQAARLSRLVDRLLDVTRLETGKLVLERERTDLATLVTQVVDNARGWSDGHVITVSTPESVAATVDPIRFGQVLANLLDNAIKFSPVGSVIDVVVAQPRPGFADVAVRDHGPGIPPAHRERIFERFYQAPGGGDVKGLGLGLYICHQIVELHDGELRVEFPPDGGVRFVACLPIESAEPASSLAAD